MLKISYILRVMALSILFGGCLAVTISAIALVSSAKAHGATAAAAATANAPMFVTFSTVILVCAILLLIGEGLDFAAKKPMNNLVMRRYISSLVAVVASFILSFAIVPPMKAMLNEIHTSEQTEQTWKTFHESARIIFGIIMLSSLSSLIVPAFEKKQIS